jgi:hypothetical protein
VSCEDGSKPQYEEDFPDAGYDDMAEYIKTSITTLQKKKRCTETSTNVTMAIITIAHHKTQQQRHEQKDRPIQ